MTDVTLFFFITRAISARNCICGFAFTTCLVYHKFQLSNWTKWTSVWPWLTLHTWLSFQLGFLMATIWHAGRIWKYSGPIECGSTARRYYFSLSVQCFSKRSIRVTGAFRHFSMGTTTQTVCMHYIMHVRVDMTWKVLFRRRLWFWKEPFETDDSPYADAIIGEEWFQLRDLQEHLYKLW